MSEAEVMYLFLFIPAVAFLFRWTWNMSGIPGWELLRIRLDFEKADDFLRPRVLRATSFSRCMLRAVGLLMMNILLLPPIFYGLEWPDRIWWLVGVVAIELAVVYRMTATNKKRYQADLEECRMLCHPDVLRLEGSIEDRPTGRCKANHTVSGGRIIRVLGQAGAYHDLFLPLAWYAVRRVEETQGPVVVFFLEWKNSGFVKDQVFPPRPAVARVDPELSDKSNSAIGVYLGFRHNPALAAKAAVWTRPVEERRA